MLVSDVVRGAAVGVVALLIAQGELRLWELIVMSVIFGAADAFFGPASMAIMPELLDDHVLVQGNALSQMSGQLSQGLIGPALGGLVVAAIGYAWSFGIDALSFVVSAMCLLAVRTRTTRERVHGTAFAEAMEGIGYVRSHRWLSASLLGAALANFFGMAPLGVLLPLLVRNVLHASALSLGVVFAAGGAAGRRGITGRRAHGIAAIARDGVVVRVRRVVARHRGDVGRTRRRGRCGVECG